YHPIAHLRVHPGELITFHALCEKAVARIDMNVEASAPQMILRDIDQDPQQQMQSGPIVCVMQVATKRVKKPQSGVGGMIKPFLFSIRKHVWDEPIANVMGEGAQNISRFQTAPGNEGETFERNHGIASPIGEPVVTGDYRSHFIAGGMRASGFFGATSRGDNELVAGKNELGRKSTARFR